MIRKLIPADQDRFGNMLLPGYPFWTRICPPNMFPNVWMPNSGLIVSNGYRRDGTGVQVPAPQFRNKAAILKGCGLFILSGRVWGAVGCTEAVEDGAVFSGQDVAVIVHCDLNRTMPHQRPLRRRMIRRGRSTAKRTCGGSNASYGIQNPTLKAGSSNCSGWWPGLWTCRGHPFFDAVVRASRNGC